MEIKPCKNDVISLLGIYLVATLCEIVFLFATQFDLFFVVVFLLLNIVLIILFMRDFVYLYRTIKIEREGCTFSFGKWSRTFIWSELNVQLCGDKQFNFYDSDISGPGILIYPKSLKCSNRIPYMTSCRYKKPFSSVYIRFRSSEDESKVNYGKLVYYGYSAERETLMDYLQSIDMVLQ